MRPDPSQGVFETMLVRAGRVQAAALHVDRLAHSVGSLYGIMLPRHLLETVHATAANLPGGEHRLRIDVVPGGEPAITTRPVPTGYRAPVSLEPLVVPGGLGAHKWRDRRLLEARPADPAPLLLDADHSVLEAAWGNFWLLEGDRLITPPADGRILPGVTRTLLLQRAASLGLRAVEEPISLNRARTAPVTFATSAIRLAVPATLTGTPATPGTPVDRLRTALS